MKLAVQSSGNKKSTMIAGIQMSHERTRKRNTQRASEMNLALVLICIVFIFIVCHIPRIVLNIHEVFMLDESIECEKKHGRKFTDCITLFAISGGGGKGGANNIWNNENTRVFK